MARDWDIKRTTFSVGDFISWNRSKSLELSPSFQRRSVWTKAQKSYLIDTVYRGLPVPIIFLREKTDVETLQTIREVVDGQQRLRTLISYADIENVTDLTASDDFVVLEKHNKDISKKTFPSLKPEFKHRILSYQFSVHVLPSDTSDSDVLSIFARMNSTGSKLNDQELRNAEFFGSLKTAVYEAAFSQLERWREWKVMSEQEIARMKEVELTSEIFMLLESGMFEQTQKKINSFYKKFDEVFPKETDIVKQFFKVMDVISEQFGKKIATSNYSNKAQFFQLFNLINRLVNEDYTFSSAKVGSILELGDRIKNRENLPEAVSVALSSRFNRLSNRNTVAKFLYDNAPK